eukprot:gene23191-28065_t
MFGQDDYATYAGILACVFALFILVLIISRGLPEGLKQACLPKKFQHANLPLNSVATDVEAPVGTAKKKRPKPKPDSGGLPLDNKRLAAAIGGLPGQLDSPQERWLRSLRKATRAFFTSCAWVIDRNLDDLGKPLLEQGIHLFLEDAPGDDNEELKDIGRVLRAIEVPEFLSVLRLQIEGRKKHVLVEVANFDPSLLDDAGLLADPLWRRLTPERWDSLRQASSGELRASQTGMEGDALQGLALQARRRSLPCDAPCVIPCDAPCIFPCDAPCVFLQPVLSGLTGREAAQLACGSTVMLAAINGTLDEDDKLQVSPCEWVVDRELSEDGQVLLEAGLHLYVDAPPEPRGAEAGEGNAGGPGGEEDEKEEDQNLTDFGQVRMTERVVHMQAGRFRVEYLDPRGLAKEPHWAALRAKCVALTARRRARHVTPRDGDAAVAPRDVDAAVAPRDVDAAAPCATLPSAAAILTHVTPAFAAEVLLALDPEAAAGTLQAMHPPGRTQAVLAACSPAAAATLLLRLLRANSEAANLAAGILAEAAPAFAAEVLQALDPPVVVSIMRAMPPPGCAQVVLAAASSATSASLLLSLLLRTQPRPDGAMAVAAILAAALVEEPASASEGGVRAAEAVGRILCAMVEALAGVLAGAPDARSIHQGGGSVEDGGTEGGREWGDIELYWAMLVNLGSSAVTASLELLYPEEVAAVLAVAGVEEPPHTEVLVAVLEGFQVHAAGLVLAALVAEGGGTVTGDHSPAAQQSAPRAAAAAAMRGMEKAHTARVVEAAPTPAVAAELLLLVEPAHAVRILLECTPGAAGAVLLASVREPGTVAHRDVDAAVARRDGDTAVAPRDVDAAVAPRDGDGMGCFGRWHTRGGQDCAFASPEFPREVVVAINRTIAVDRELASGTMDLRAWRGMGGHDPHVRDLEAYMERFMEAYLHAKLAQGDLRAKLARGAAAEGDPYATLVQGATTGGGGGDAGDGLVHLLVNMDAGTADVGAGGPGVEKEALDAVQHGKAAEGAVRAAAAGDPVAGTTMVNVDMKGRDYLWLRLSSAGDLAPGHLVVEDSTPPELQQHLIEHAAKYGMRHFQMPQAVKLLPEVAKARVWKLWKEGFRRAQEVVRPVIDKRREKEMEATVAETVAALEGTSARSAAAALQMLAGRFRTAVLRGLSPAGLGKVLEPLPHRGALDVLDAVPSAQAAAALAHTPGNVAAALMVDMETGEACRLLEWLLYHGMVAELGALLAALQPPGALALLLGHMALDLAVSLLAAALMDPLVIA